MLSDRSTKVKLMTSNSMTFQMSFLSLQVMEFSPVSLSYPFSSLGSAMVDLGENREAILLKKANAIKEVRSLSMGSVARFAKITLARSVIPLAEKKAVSQSVPERETPFHR